MPKFLSRSKHEEFESNLALQIRDQKEKREKKIQIKWNLRNLVPVSTIHHDALFTSSVTVHLVFDTLPVCFNFCFFQFYPL